MILRKYKNSLLNTIKAHDLDPKLFSAEDGLIGTEDFMAPERHFKGTVTKPLELCDTLQPKGWGYLKSDDVKHKTSDQVMEMLKKAAGMPANLLLNTGPLPDGSIPPEDVATLKKVGSHIRIHGWPQ